jgi:hypothetical protein
MYPHKSDKKIVMIGFGKLGEQLLYWGLLNMIFSPDEVIEYHIFGDGDKFKSVHHEMPHITDKVIFHDEQWYTQLPLIESADLAIVAEQHQQMELLSNLMVAIKTQIFYVFVASSNIIELLDSKTYLSATSEDIIKQLNEKIRLIIFKWKEDSQKLSYIFEDDLLETAKRINMRYEHLKNNTEETKANREKEWHYLDNFERYSNISVADYHDIRLETLKKKKIDSNPDKIDEATLEKLAELEHIRWCRYYYLNNWKHGEIRNEINCTHPNLVPYKDLTEEDKQKDRENIRTLLKLDLTNDINIL